MRNETIIRPPAKLPQQAPPVTRTVCNAMVAGGVEASDNDHNTNTEHDVFFVDMS